MIIKPEINCNSSYNGRDELILYSLYRDYLMVGECVRFLFTSCEGSLDERVSAVNE